MQHNDYTVKAEIFGGVLFSVTSVPEFLPKIKRTENVGIVLVRLPEKRVYRKFPSTKPPILENTENITPPEISAFTVGPRGVTSTHRHITQHQDVGGPWSCILYAWLCSTLDNCTHCCIQIQAHLILGMDSLVRKSRK